MFEKIKTLVNKNSVSLLFGHTLYILFAVKTLPRLKQVPGTYVIRKSYQYLKPDRAVFRSDELDILGSRLYQLHATTAVIDSNNALQNLPAKQSPNRAIIANLPGKFSSPHLTYIQRWKVFVLAYNRRGTLDKRPLGRDPDMSWRHRHTTSMIKLFWSEAMAPWASTAAYGQGEKFSA